MRRRYKYSSAEEAAQAHRISNRECMRRARQRPHGAQIFTGRNRYNMNPRESVDFSNPHFKVSKDGNMLLCSFCPRPAVTAIERMIIVGEKLIPTRLPWCGQEQC
jgi:hypothetical protein